MARIRSRQIESGAINQRALGSGAVEQRHIARWAVGHDEILPGAVGEAHLGSQAIKEQHLDPRLVPRDVAVIDLGDGPAFSGFSRGFLVLRPCTLHTIGATLSVAGSTDTVGVAYKNGVSLGSVVIPASSTGARMNLPAEFDAGDTWQMNVTTVGTGASGLAWFGWFS